MKVIAIRASKTSKAALNSEICSHPVASHHASHVPLIPAPADCIQYTFYLFNIVCKSRVTLGMSHCPVFWGAIVVQKRNENAQIVPKMNKCSSHGMYFYSLKRLHGHTVHQFN